MIFMVNILVELGVGSKVFKVLNVYIPPEGIQRKQALKDIEKVIIKIFRNDLSAKLVIMGDFNMTPAKVDKLLKKWRFPLSRLESIDRPETFQRLNNRMTILDYFVVSIEMQNLLSICKVDRYWDISDHWPLMGFLRKEEVEVEDQHEFESFKIDVRKIKPSSDAISNHNVWDVLLDNEETIMNQFDKAVKDVAIDVGIVIKPKKSIESFNFV